MTAEKQTMNDTKIKISCVIPAYNEEKNIRQAVASLRRQNISRNEYEIIVVDNNSSDATSDEARKAGADKVIVEKNKGTNMARARGVAESKGKIIAFLDADSEAPYNWLEKITEYLKQPGVAAVSGPYDYGFTGLKKLADEIYNKLILYAMIPPLLYLIFRRKAGILFGGNFASTKSAIKKIGGIPPIAFWGDDATMAMLFARRVGKVFFDPSLRVKSSPRRFEKYGIWLTFLYAKAYLKAYFSVPK